MAKFSGNNKNTISPKIKVKRSSKVLRYQRLNTLLLLSMLVYLTKEYWLPMLLGLLK